MTELLPHPPKIVKTTIKTVNALFFLNFIMYLCSVIDEINDFCSSGNAYFILSKRSITRGVITLNNQKRKV